MATAGGRHLSSALNTYKLRPSLCPVTTGHFESRFTHLVRLPAVSCVWQGSSRMILLMKGGNLGSRYQKTRKGNRVLQSEVSRPVVVGCSEDTFSGATNFWLVGLTRQKLIVNFLLLCFRVNKSGCVWRIVAPRLSNQNGLAVQHSTTLSALLLAAGG